MRIIDIAKLPVLVTTLLAGCVMEPGEDGVDGIDEDLTSETEGSEPDASEPAASDDAALPARPLDGNAAAAAELRALDKGTVTPTSLTSWYSGAIEPGVTKHWYWNNSSLTAAYQVGLSPIGASISSPCKLEVTRTWDVQKYGGEREFHFYVKNTGAITCGANILLDSTQRSSTWTTGGMEPGASKSWTWNNANPLSAAHFAGVSPSGATSANDCELEVTRAWYVQQPSGEREFKFTVKNVGDIACQGDIQLAQTTSSSSIWSTGAMSPGVSKSWTWNNANPLDRIYVPGLSPGGASGLTACQLEVTQSYYQQKINTDGTPEREFHLTVKNVGSLACSGAVLLNYVN